MSVVHVVGFGMSLNPTKNSAAYFSRSVCSGG